MHSFISIPPGLVNMLTCCPQTHNIDVVAAEGFNSRCGALMDSGFSPARLNKPPFGQLCAGKCAEQRVLDPLPDK